MNSTELEKQTVVQLREQLKSRGLLTSGNKQALIQRLVDVDSANIEENILSGNDSSGVEDPDLGPITEDDVLGIESDSATNTLISTDESAEKAVNGEKKEMKTEVKRDSVPVDSVTRKLQRAEKFQIAPNLSPDEAKKLRAQRFATEAKTVTSGNSETLKKRAERFGVPIAPKLSSESEKMSKERRAERFGLTEIISGPGSVDTEKINKRRIRFGSIPESAQEADEKRRKRAERFAKS